jgi:hypothetical protein
MESAPDQTFLLVCAVFYMADNLRMHDPRKLFIAETWDGRWRMLFPLHCFRLRGRLVTLLPPLVPFALVVELGLATRRRIRSDILKAGKTMPSPAPATNGSISLARRNQLF